MWHLHLLHAARIWEQQPWVWLLLSGCESWEIYQYRPGPQGGGRCDVQVLCVPRAFNEIDPNRRVQVNDRLRASPRRRGLLGRSRQSHVKHKQLKKFSKEQLSMSPGREAGVWTEQRKAPSPVSNEVTNRTNRCERSMNKGSVTRLKTQQTAATMKRGRKRLARLPTAWPTAFNPDTAANVTAKGISRLAG